MYMCMCMCLCSEQFNKNRHPVFSLCNNKTMEGHKTQNTFVVNSLKTPQKLKRTKKKISTKCNNKKFLLSK